MTLLMVDVDNDDAATDDDENDDDDNDYKFMIKIMISHPSYIKNIIRDSASFFSITTFSVFFTLKFYYFEKVFMAHISIHTQNTPPVCIFL